MYVLLEDGRGVIVQQDGIVEGGQNRSKDLDERAMGQTSGEVVAK